MRYTHNQFFTSIRIRFGYEPVYLLKRWIKCRKSIIVNKLKIRFLRKCQHKEIFPTHINGLLNKLDGNFANRRSTCEFRSARVCFLKKLVRLEIDDSYRSINKNYKQIYVITQKINCVIPDKISISFFNSLSGPLFSYYLTTLVKLEKFKSLFQRHNPKSEIMPVHYFALHDSSPHSFFKSLTTNHFISSYNLKTRSNLTEVTVSPSLFTAGHQDPMINNKKWFMNLSFTDIPKDIINFLQLGENFSLPINNRTYAKIEFIKNFENSIMRLPSDKRSTIRNRKQIS